MLNQKKYYLYQMDISISNIFSIIIYIFLFLLVYLVKDFFQFSIENFYISVALMIPYLILHELIHSLSYVVNGANFKNITYGCHLEKSILCCLCKQNITKKNILISLLSPLFFIGILTLIISLTFKLEVLFYLSIINIGGCSGDIIMFYHLVKLKNFEFSEYDNPIAFGLYGDGNLENKKMFGLKYLGVQEKLERNDLKKIDIDTKNTIFLILFILGSILLLIF